MIIPKNSSKISIETNKLKAGVYYLRMTNSKINDIARFVVIE
jgi:hypothetical protein